jgi:hypothetical protein
MKRLVRDIADANISVTCMPITCAATFDLGKFWKMVIIVNYATAVPAAHTSMQGHDR